MVSVPPPAPLALTLLALLLPVALGGRIRHLPHTSALLQADAALPPKTAIVAPAIAAASASAFTHPRAPRRAALPAAPLPPSRLGATEVLRDEEDGTPGTWLEIEDDGRAHPRATPWGSHAAEHDDDGKWRTARPEDGERGTTAASTDAGASETNRHKEDQQKPGSWSVADRGVDAGEQHEPSFWHGEAQRGSQDVPALETVPARHMLEEGKTAWGEVALPMDWAFRFEPGSVDYWDHLPGQDVNPSFFGTARLAPSGELVKFASWAPSDPRTARHIRISQMLGHTGAVPEIREVREHPEATFVMTESTPGLSTLASVIEHWQDKPGRAGRLSDQPVVPLTEALPLMASMLRNLEALQRNSVVHGDLTEDIILVLSDAGGTLVDDFRSACVLHTGDVEISRAGLWDAPAVGSVSAYRQAPEMTSDGLPSHLSENVWQLGLVFARMIVGDFVPAWMKEKFDDSNDESRHEIHHAMVDHFDIWSDTNLRALYEGGYADVAGIVAGMLEKDPQRRWSAQEALAEVEAAARQREIPVRPGGRSGEAAAPEWSDDAFQHRGPGVRREEVRRDRPHHDFQYRQAAARDEPVDPEWREDMFQPKWQSEPGQDWSADTFRSWQPTARERSAREDFTAPEWGEDIASQPAPLDEEFMPPEWGDDGVFHHGPPVVPDTEWGEDTFERRQPVGVPHHDEFGFEDDVFQHQPPPEGFESPEWSDDLFEYRHPIPRGAEWDDDMPPMEQETFDGPEWGEDDFSFRHRSPVETQRQGRPMWNGEVFQHGRAAAFQEFRNPGRHGGVSPRRGRAAHDYFRQEGFSPEWNDEFRHGRWPEAQREFDPAWAGRII